MILNIMLMNDDPNYQHMYDKIGNPIHESFVGNTDYIESNIALDLKLSAGQPVCSLFVSGGDCQDKEYIRTKLKNAIDIFVNTL